jgi:hypothetical protein
MRKKRKRNDTGSETEGKTVKDEGHRVKKKKQKLEHEGDAIGDAAKVSAFRFAITRCMWGENDDIFWEDPEEYDYKKEDEEMTGEEVILGMAVGCKDPVEIIRAQAEYFHRGLGKQERRWWFEHHYQSSVCHLHIFRL